MVGIIVASHGEFANGILQTSQMISGEEKNVVACTLMPSESPEDIRRKMQEAIDSFESQEEILFLVDFFGGSPFNQASAMLEGHDKWAIISGMNVPMLIEVFAAREDGDSAHEIVKNVLEVSREGIKAIPEALEPVKKEAKPQKEGLSGKIPEGTVIGDGKIKYVLARIDTRLLHGQVATSWTKTTKPDRIIVVSDAVSKDALRKNMIEQATPPGVKAHVVPISKMIEVDKDTRFGNTRALVLFETPQDALKAIEGGMKVKELNLGSMAHSLGKVVLTRSVSMDKNDVETFEKLTALGVKIDVRKVPSDSPENFENIIKKAKAELTK